MSDIGWIRRAEPDKHQCPAPQAGSFDTPDGGIGDLWRCPECRKLWRIAYACDACQAYGHLPHGGAHLVGYAWRLATGWQRFTTWLRRRR